MSKCPGRRRNRVVPGLVWLASWLAGVTVAEAQVQSATYNHLKDSVSRAFELTLSDGEPFTIIIEETCEEEFTYEITAYERPDPPRLAGPMAAAMLKPLATKTIPMVHDARYGGYFVAISRKPDATTPLCTGSDTLRPRTLIVSTPLREWDLAFSGGFTVSSLTNPVYHLKAHPADSTKKQVQEERDKRDWARLGIGTFVHVYHRDIPWLGPMFGLGIRDGNKTEYFLGGGVRFSDKATMNVGLALGPVTRLPDGVNTTDPVTNDNALNTLPTRVARGFFFGITYSFINVRSKLEQPFAGAPGTGAGAAGSGATAASTAAAPKPSTAAACTYTVSPQTLTFAQTGGTQQVDVTTGAGCAWNVRVAAASTLDVAFKPDMGTGPGSFQVISKPNTGGMPQKGAIDVSGQMIAITRN